MLIRWMVLLIGVPLGFWVMRYKDRIVGMVGKMEWAERYLGEGGTYNMWSLIGLAIIIGSFLFFFGLFPGLS